MKEYKINEVLDFSINPNIIVELKKTFKINKQHPIFISLAEKEYEGHMVKMYSQRYELFKKKGTKCITCGVEGTYFLLEKSNGGPKDVNSRRHFNLYGLNDDGEEVLITKDHILPKSKGGKNHIDNFQVMCTKCNKEKGDKVK